MSACQQWQSSQQMNLTQPLKQSMAMRLYYTLVCYNTIKENSHAFKVMLYCLLALSNYQDFYGLPPQTVVAAYFQTFYLTP